MPTSVPVTFRVSPMPTYAMNPQVFAEQLVARMSLDAQDNIAFISTGSVLPTSNVGAFLFNGLTWYVWDVTTGAYIPQPLSPLSIRIAYQNTAPDQTKYDLWVYLDGTGKAQDIRFYSGGAWKSVYEDKFATYSTTVQMNTAISSANVSYAASAQMTADQVLPVDTFFHKLVFDDDFINPNSAYNSGLARYIAPVTGVYRANANLQVDNTTAVAASLETNIRIVVNGVVAATSLPISGTAVATPPGLRWYPAIAGLVMASVGDYIEVYMSARDGTNTGNVSISKASQFFVELVQPT